MSGRIRLALAALFTLLLLPASARAATHMPIGFYDDASFRWSDNRVSNLEQAAAAGATVIHTTAAWPQIAPTRPAQASDGNDPAYNFADLDELVDNAPRFGLRVMIDITGTPKWANGGKPANHMPTHLSDLTTFAQMLATRYNGQHGHGVVGLWAVWNEPNLSLFLTPQYSGKKIVSPAEYAKLYRAGYAGIKAGNAKAQIAIGETSPLGRDHPTSTSGQGQSVAPGTFARLLAQQKGLKFAAWAHHPYPTALNAKPLEKVRYPNVSLSQLPRFETQLRSSFHHAVAIWITEYGHETKPAEPHGVTYAQQAAYAKQALKYARADRNVQMFVWFTFRDSATNPWQSGVEQSSGTRKPVYGPFASLARLIDGTTQAVKAGRSPKVTSYVPALAFYTPVGSVVGITYAVSDRGKIVARGEPIATLAADESITYTTEFTPRKGHTYTVTAVVNERNGHTEKVVAALVAG